MPSEPTFKNPPSTEPAFIPADPLQGRDRMHRGISSLYRFNQGWASLNLLIFIGSSTALLTIAIKGGLASLTSQLSMCLLAGILIGSSLFCRAIGRVSYYKRANWVVRNTTPQQSAVCLRLSKWTGRAYILVIDLSSTTGKRFTVKQSTKVLTQMPGGAMNMEEDELLQVLLYTDPMTKVPVAVKIHGTVFFIVCP